MARKPILPDENGEYTEQQLKRLRNRAWNSAVWHLGRAPHTEFQIREKLKKKLIPKDIIDSTIQQLVDAKWLNDEDYAENFIYSKRKYEKLGVSAIRMKLSQKGVDREIIDRLLADIDQEELTETAYILAEKKLRSLRREPDKQKRIQKMVSFLAYRGYNATIAYQVAKDVVENNLETEE